MAADFTDYFRWVEDAEDKFGGVYHDMQHYLRGSFLDIPDGFVITDGALHQERFVWDNELGGWKPQF